MDKDGKTWWWCPHHKAEGLFDGLYVTHKPEDHDEWKKDKRNYRRNKNSSSSSETDSNSGSKKLQLTESMKQALMTDGNMTEEQATALWTKILGN